MASSTLSTLRTEAGSLADVIEATLQNVRTGGGAAKGISLLSTKNDVLLAYLHQLVLVAQLQLAGRPLDDATRGELVRSRLILEKMRPLEQKLRSQIDKLVLKADAFAETGTSAEAHLEDIANDPLAFRPNPANLVSARAASRSGSEDEGPSGGIYRPPRVAPVPYPGDQSKKRKRDRENAPPSALVREVAAGLSSVDPYAETTSGLATAPSFGSKRSRELAEMQRYEEDNMTRLFLSKKKQRQRTEDEADLALGGSGSFDRRGGGPRGGFAELDDFVGQLDRSQKRTGKEYARMREQRPNLPIEASTRGRGGGRGGRGRGNGRKPAGASFAKDLKKASRGKRRS